MSGGSWDYFYINVEDVAGRLMRSSKTLRVGLGSHLMDVAKAMKAIEWNDSGDGDDDEEQLLRAVVPVERITETVAARIADLRRDLAELAKVAGGKA